MNKRKLHWLTADCLLRFLLPPYTQMRPETGGEVIYIQLSTDIDQSV